MLSSSIKYHVNAIEHGTYKIQPRNILNGDWLITNLVFKMACLILYTINCSRNDLELFSVCDMSFKFVNSDDLRFSKKLLGIVNYRGAIAFKKLYFTQISS